MQGSAHCTKCCCGPEVCTHCDKQRTRIVCVCPKLLLGCWELSQAQTVKNLVPVGGLGIAAQLRTAVGSSLILLGGHLVCAVPGPVGNLHCRNCACSVCREIYAFILRVRLGNLQVFSTPNLRIIELDSDYKFSHDLSRFFFPRISCFSGPWKDLQLRRVGGVSISVGRFPYAASLFC